MNQTVEFDKVTDQGIYYRHWPINGDDAVKGVILLVHGLGEHCERYQHMADFFNQNGYVICSMDLPGHGHSDGIRGHVDSFDDYTNSVITLHDKIKHHYPENKIYLLGHSMGGLIAAKVLLDHQDLFKAALLSGPAIQSPQEPPAIQIMIIKLLAMIAPKFGAIVLDADKISRDPLVVETYMNDPLVNKGKLSTRFLVEMFATMQTCKDNASNITLPISIMHGGEDVMTAPAGSELLHNSIGSEDKTLKIYEGLYHEIFNEPESQDIFNDVLVWLNKH